jgi:chemotaxis protein MotB
MDKAAPVIVKRVRKVAAGHHGGAWKVAYADFVTAMMAFFLVLWLVGVASKKEKAAISEYFKNPSAVVGRSATPSASTAGPGGAADKMLPTTDPILVPRGVGAASGTAVSRDPDADQLERRERRALEALKRDIERAIDANGALARFHEQLLLDITSEGLRIQILDREQRPMFDLGSVTLKPYTQAALRELGAMLQQRQNRIAISGHTDEVQFHAPRGYGNWELSAERANAARRALVDGGLTENKIARVVGLAASEPLDRDDPLAPVNRRISIVVLNRAVDGGVGTAVGDRSSRVQADERGLALH